MAASGSKECLLRSDGTRVKPLLLLKTSILQHLWDNRRVLEQMHNSGENHLDAFLDYSRDITLSESAPNGWTVGMPLFHGHAPSVQAEEMRAGALESYLVSYEASHAVDSNQRSTFGELKPEEELLSVQMSGLKRKHDTQIGTELVQQGSSAADVLTGADRIEQSIATGVSADGDNHIIAPQQEVQHQTTTPSRELHLSFGTYDSDSEGSN